MLSSYWKIFVRTFARQRIYSFINITGLAIGITCFLILSLFVIDEAGYDKFYPKADQIYRVIIQSRFMGKESINSKTAAPLGSALKNDFPEVENYTRIGYFGQHNLRYNDKVFREYDIYTADSTYFEIFPQKFIYGDPKGALSRPNSIVISETASKRYFGNENPVGRTFSVDDNSGTYLITGVMKDYPRKTHHRHNFLLSMSTYRETAAQDWLNLGYSTFVTLRKGTDPEEFNNKMRGTILKYVGPQASRILGFSFDEFNKRGNTYSYIIQPLTSIYLYSQSRYGIDPNSEWGHVRLSNISYSYIFMAVGTFILLIAVFNFMNLSTARSEKRAREVGIRKTLGSDRQKIIFQFISESIFTSTISVLFSIMLVELILPSFGRFVGKELSLRLFENFYTIPILILFTIAVGVLAGSYPAFYLSSFQSSHILKSSSGKKSRKSRVRSSLVILQFAISITLIIGTIIIKDQLDFIQNKNLGFRKDHLISLNDGSALRQNVKPFLEEISKIPEVASSSAHSLMFASGVPGNGYVFDRMAGTEVISAQFLDVDYNFLKTYQIEVKQGRYFSEEFPTDSNAAIVNESMAKEFNTKDPIGKTLASVHASTNELIPYKIIGVIKDFNYESLHKKVSPLVLHLSPVRQASTVITIRVSSDNFNRTISKIEKVWGEFAAQEPFSYTFMDENLERMYNAEKKIGLITTVFSALAIFIACLGLFGLVSFITEQRTKEIGVRKVLGASIGEIILLLSKEFIKWVLLANIISWPIAFYVMNNWLSNFAYRINIGWAVFLISGGAALIIALVTVSIQITKTALRNPVSSLRYE